MILPATRSTSAAAVLIGALLVLLVCFFAGPVRAQEELSAQEGPGEPQVSLEYFRERLEPFGAWFTHPIWGEVWQPDAAPGFRPYFDGRWEYTSDYGSLWISNEPYGDIVYHYGRWVFDRDDGWLWIPDYVWAPSWVVWRANQDYVGWLPMPPGYFDYYTLFPSPYLANNWYGYQTFYGPIYGPTFVSEHYFTLWVFVLNKDFGDGDGHRGHHVKDIAKVRDLYYRSTDRTRYVVDRDRIVDRFTDRNWWQRRAGREVEERPARERFRRGDARITSVSEGRTISRRYTQNDPDRRFPRGPVASDGSADASAKDAIAPARSIDRTTRDRTRVARPDAEEKGLGRRSAVRFGPGIPGADNRAGEQGANQVPATGLDSPRSIDRVTRSRGSTATPGVEGNALTRRSAARIGSRAQPGAPPNPVPSMSDPATVSAPLPPTPRASAIGRRTVAGGIRPYTDSVTGVTVRRGIGSAAPPRQTGRVDGSTVVGAGAAVGAAPPVAGAANPVVGAARGRASLQSNSGTTAPPPSSPRTLGRGGLAGTLSGGTRSFQGRGF